MVLKTFIQGRASIYDPDRHNIAPRIGIAYSPNPHGSNRVTVLRAGYGIFYDQILGAVVSQSRNVFPSFFTLNFGGGPFTSITQDFPLELFNPATNAFGNLQTPIVAAGTLNRLNPQLPLTTLLPSLLRFFPTAISPTIPIRRLPMPAAQHYGLTVDQQLSRDVVFYVAYAGTRASHLLRFTSPNLGPSLNLSPNVLTLVQNAGLGIFIPEFLGRGATPARSVGGLGAISIFETTGRSRYDSLQLQVCARLGRHLQYQAAYTLSSARDDVSDVFNLAGSFALPQNSQTFAGEYGPANFDARHRLAYHFICLDSVKSQVRFARLLFRSMEIAGAGQFQTGQPFTVNTTIDINQDGNLTDRLNTMTGLVTTGNGREPLVLTTANTMSLLAPFGQGGRIGRNSFRAGSTLDLNLSVIKKFSSSSRQGLTLRTDFFNFLNRTNFGIPIRLLEAPGFGQATNTVTPGRRVQFSVKYSF